MTSYIQHDSGSLEALKIFSRAHQSFSHVNTESDPASRRQIEPARDIDGNASLASSVASVAGAYFERPLLNIDVLLVQEQDEVYRRC